MVGDSDIILRPHMHVDPHTADMQKRKEDRGKEKRGKEEGKKKVLGQFLLIFFFRLLF